MARADDPENLLSYFDFKEKLEKKIKKKEKKQEEIPAYEYDSDVEDGIPDWARDDFEERYDKKYGDVVIPETTITHDTPVIDKELVDMIEKKEKENKELQKKHKKEIEKELGEEDV